MISSPPMTYRLASLHQQELRTHAAHRSLTGASAPVRSRAHQQRNYVMHTLKTYAISPRHPSPISRSHPGIASMWRS